MKYTVKLFLFILANAVYPVSAHALDSGEYRNIYDVEAKDTTDTVLILEDFNKIHFLVSISLPNHEPCGFEGTAFKAVGFGYYEYRETVVVDDLTPDHTANAECILDLHEDRDELYLEDIGQICQQVYCQQGSGFDGVRFRKIR